jgi:fermentation-respiration switch protein FrsA (DUF1100 family)
VEQLAVPVLIISARDDPLAPYRFAAAAASRIPRARLVTIERGGHLFLGHDAKMRNEISAFVASAGPTEAFPVASAAANAPCHRLQPGRSCRPAGRDR